jgi:hypothetical protein
MYVVKPGAFEALTANSVYEAVTANELVTINDAVPNRFPVIPSVTNKLPVITADPLNGNPAPPPAFKANDAVVANDELIAF